jgi:raffinose/stachyose/melibiose transport system substrate-binding protein
VYVDGSYGINATSKHKEEALRFINFLASAEYGQMFADELSQPSAVPGVKPKHPVLAEMLALAEKRSAPHLMLVGFRFEQPSGSTLLQNDLQGMFSDKLTPEQVAADIQAGLAKWYKPFQK